MTEPKPQVERDPARARRAAEEAEEEYRQLQDDDGRGPDVYETIPSGETIDEDRHDAADRDHAPDRPPTSDEEAVADEFDLDPEVAEQMRAANERGANVKGEGQIE